MASLDVAAGVAGLLSLGIQITQSLVNFYSEYKNQKSDITYTTKKLNRLLDVFVNLQSITKRKTCSDEQQLPRMIEDSIHDCKDCIQELGAELNKFEKPPKNDGTVVIKTVARKIAYPFRRSTLQKLDENIDEIVAQLSFTLQVVGQKDLLCVQDNIEETKALLDLVRADQLSSNIRDWLHAPEVTSNYNDACRKWYPGTGLWLIQGSIFNNWLIKQHSFLWLNGFAGCGKSVLCSTAIRYTYRYQRSNPRIGIAFFFFTFDDESKQDASAILRALILQLSNQFNGHDNPLLRLYHNSRNSTPLNQVFMDCLLHLVQAFEDVYIFIDALDESPRGRHRSDVLQVLEDLWARGGAGLHMLVTSRDEVDIRELLCKDLRISPENIIALKSESINADIASFISGYLKTNRTLQRLEQYHGQIEKTLAEGANGVFRWVECQLIALESGCASKKQLDALLRSLPRDLDKTYERILSSIDIVFEEDARRILALLCCTKRPLTIAELIEGIAVELGDDPRLNPEARLFSEDEIHRICPGLLEIDISDKENETVRLAHFSVQEYLESERAIERFRVQKLVGNAEVASVCLTYLLEPKLSMPETSIGDYPLAKYAAQNWYKHYYDGDRSIPHVRSQIARLFTSNRSVFESWINIWNPEDRYGIKPVKVPSPFYYASLLGLLEIVTQLLKIITLAGKDSRALVNEQGGKYGNPLQAALFNGHKEVAQQLLDKGANINAQNGFYGNALQMASSEGYKEIVQLLLDKGADVNAQNGFHGNALQMASLKGHEDIAQLLIEKGAKGCSSDSGVNL